MEQESWGRIPRLLKPKEAARALRISEKTLSAWRRLLSCPLPFVQLGHSVRYRQDDIIKFLQSSAAPRSMKPLSRVKPEGSVKAKKTA